MGAAPEATLREEWYIDMDAPVMEEDAIDKSSLSAIMVVEYDSDCVGSDDMDSFLCMELLRSSELSKKDALPKNGSVSDTVSMVEFLASFSTSLSTSIVEDSDD